jgi:translation initiation factor IF-3
MDFGKYRYDESRKRRQARKHQHSHSVKEIKFHVNVAEHDYRTKVNHVRAFLDKGHKVKITLTFRGRENAHRELGFDLVRRVLKDCEDHCAVDMEPKMMGRSIVAMLGSRMRKAKSAK